MSVYMPVLDTSINNINVYSDTLNVISGLLKTYDDYKVLIGGDLNLDFNRDVNTSVFKIF